MKKTGIEFPCEFPIKVMTKNTEDAADTVISILKPVYGPVDAIHSKHSRNGNYLAHTVTIKATSQDQLDQIYQALSAHPDVLMSL